MLFNRNFGDLVTFARASARWRFNSSGVLVQDAANVPSLDYDPITLAPRGMLVEEGRTNRIFPSVYAGSGWTVGASGVASAPVITANAAVAPDGSVTAARVDFALNGGTSATDFSILSFPAASYTNAVTDTASVWLRTVDGSSKAFRILTPDGGVVQAITVTGVWTRFSVTSTPASSSSGSTRLRLRGGEGTADSASVYVWGGQLEAGAFASGYIATTTAQATRAADSAIITDLSKIGFNAGEGTVVCEILMPLLVGSPKGLFSFHDGTTANRFLCAFSGANFITQSIVASSQINFGTAALPAAGERMRVAMRYKSGQFAMSVNGGAPVTNATLTVPPGITGLRLGGTQVANAELLNSPLRVFNYIPVGKSNSELQSLSA